MSSTPATAALFSLTREEGAAFFLALMKHVWLLQCKCPSGHCLLAVPYERDDDDETEDAHRIHLAYMMQALDDQIAHHHMNPWCGLCHAKKEHWQFHSERTIYRTIEEAMPALREMELAQRLTALANHAREKAQQN